MLKHSHVLLQQPPRTYLQHPHIVPLAHNGVHVVITHKKAHNAVRNHRRQLHQQAPIISNHRWVIAHVKLGRNGPLIRPPGEHHRAQAVPGERHVERLHHHRVECQDFGVEVDGGEGARGDYDGLVFGKHGFHGQRGIEAGELDDWVGDTGHAFVKWLDDDGKAVCVCREGGGG